MKHLITFILSVVLLSACGESERNNRLLQRAERVMDDSADVALAILCDSIDTSTLRTDRSRAIYALLLSQAYDKNYIDISSDSIIAPAVEYFADGNEPHYAMLTHYYHGRILENSGDAHNAIAQYTKAEEYISNTSDTLIHGLIYSRLGDLYSNSCDYPKSIDAYLNAYEFYKSANKYEHKIFALYDAACSYRGNLDYKNAYIKIKQVISEAYDSSDVKMIGIGYEELIILLTETKKYNEAIALYDSLKFRIKGYGSTFAALHTNIASAYANEGDVQKSQEHIDSALLLASTPNDSIIVFRGASYIYETLDEHRKALMFLKKSVSLENDKLREELKQPLLTAQRDVLERNLEIAHYKQKLTHYTLYIIILLTLLVICIVVYIAKKRIVRKQQILESYADTIFELRDSLKSKDVTHSIILREVFDGQIAVLNNIGSALVGIEENAGNYKRIYHELNEIITHLENPKTISALEKLIDKCKGNIMQTLRCDLPDLSNEEYRQVCYHYAGFSPKFISLLMQQKFNTIYRRRLRIKEKILASHSLKKNYCCPIKLG